MQWYKIGAIFLTVWLMQQCCSDETLLAFLNGQRRCNEDEKINSAQAVQAKIVHARGLSGCYDVIYPEVAISSSTAQ